MRKNQLLSVLGALLMLFGYGYTASAQAPGGTQPAAVTAQVLQSHAPGEKIILSFSPFDALTMADLQTLQKNGHDMFSFFEINVVDGVAEVVLAAEDDPSSGDAEVVMFFEHHLNAMENDRIAQGLRDEVPAAAVMPSDYQEVPEIDPALIDDDINAPQNN